MSESFILVDEIVKATGGKLLQKQDTFAYGISTDSRTLDKGDLFIPLKGENFDGHDYIQQAVDRGAAIAIISEDLKVKVGITLIKVPDTLKALQDLGAYHRKAYPFKIVGITGSNGKTTTKFFTENLLSHQYKTFASQKSFNNHFGVPLTLLALKPDVQYGIVEIGMNHPGEISALTKLADPDITLVTTVGRAHLMDFGGVDGIAKEKSDIYRFSRTDTIKVFNLDNPSTAEMYEEFKGKGKAITFASNRKDVDVHFVIKEMGLEHIRIEGSIQGVSGEVVVPVFGAHNVTNLMGATGIALAAGMTPENIWAALPSCKTVWGRNMLVKLKDDAKLIFDGYNANPDSMKALIENLSKVTSDGKKFVILGDMLEMGDQAEELHEELGEFVGRKNFDVVWFLGEFSKAFEAGIRHSGFQKSLMISKGYEESLATTIASMVEPSDIVVMKGSRGAKLEKLVPHFNPLNWNPNK